MVPSFSLSWPASMAMAPWQCHCVLLGLPWGPGRWSGPGSLSILGWVFQSPTGSCRCGGGQTHCALETGHGQEVPLCCAAPLTSGPQPPLPARPVQLAGSATVIGGAVKGVVAAQPLADLASTGSPSRNAAAIHNNVSSCPAGHLRHRAYFVLCSCVSKAPCFCRHPHELTILDIRALRTYH